MVKFADPLPEPVMAEVPLLTLLLELLTRLGHKEIRLTPKGNLPDRYVEAGYVSLRGEDDYLPAQVIKHLVLRLGWAKKRNGKLNLTKVGKQIPDLPRGECFRQCFVGHLRGFNLGWADGHSESNKVQFVFPYLAYLLLTLDKQERPVDDYADHLVRAFPALTEEYPRYFSSVVFVRLFVRFLEYYGLVTTNGDKHVTMTDRFGRVFVLDPDAKLPTSLRR